MKASTAPFRLRDWPRVPRRQRRAVYVLVLCIIFFLASAASVVSLLVWDSRQATPVFLLRAHRAQSVPVSAEAAGFPGGRLPSGEDAGEGYCGETLWVGDSNTVRMLVYGLISRDGAMAVEGMGIEGAREKACVYFEGDARAYTIPEAVAMVRPRRVIVTLGTNDAAGQLTLEEFLEEYHAFADALRRASPESDLILNAIPPIGERCAYPDIDQGTVDQWNKALEELALEEGLPFLNSADVLKSQSGCARPEYVIEDGLHLNRTALEALMEYVRLHPYQTLDRRQSAGDVPVQRAPPP